MKNLVILNNDTPVTTSLKVAEVFGKNHRHVLDSIRDVIKQNGGMPKIGQTPMFEETTYIHEQNGQTYPMFYLNRDGFALLAMGFTGKKALAFKLKYIKAFNKMEEKLKQLLSEGKDQLWRKTPRQITDGRKAETAVIKLFIEFAKSQGYCGDDKAVYSKFSIWANRVAGLKSKNDRDNGTIQQLNMVGLAENGIKNIILKGIRDGLHYTQIIAEVELWIDEFKKISFVESYISSVPLID